MKVPYQLVADGDLLLLRYSPTDVDPDWVRRLLAANRPVRLKGGSFVFDASDMVTPHTSAELEDGEFEGEYFFVLGELDGEYFRIKPRVVRTRNTFYFHVDCRIQPKWLVATRNIPVLRRIDRLVAEDVYVGGDKDQAIPEQVYLEMLDRFPNSYELTKYADARVQASVADYLETADEAERSYHRYMNRRVFSRPHDPIAPFRQHEVAKYQAMHTKLTNMLAEEDAYTEMRWQEEIAAFVRLIYPKYLCALREGPVGRAAGGTRDKGVDFVMVDAGGYVDLLEIKRPFSKPLLTPGRDRDNHIPRRDLTAAVMQIEKYIYHLTRAGVAGEQKLAKKFQGMLPEGLAVKVVNPKALIIMGRTAGLSESQLDDFEVVKRKYRNVIDIITYDDLLERLGFMLSQMRDGSPPSTVDEYEPPIRSTAAQ